MTTVNEREGLDPSEQEFDAFKGPAMTYNESLNVKFDRIAKRLSGAVDDKISPELNKIDEGLQSRYEDLRSKISSLRRQGKEMLIPSLTLRQFPAKIALARSRREKIDFERVRILLEQVAFEIREAVDAKQVDVKSEVFRLAGLSDDIGTHTIK